MSQIILNRISPVVETFLRKEQAGFRRSRSCADHTNTLRIIIEQSVEHNCQLYLLFVDFQRAFDTVSRPALWSALASRGIPEKIITLIKEMYRDSENSVNFNGSIGEPFLINSGVKQGCVLSPTLFLILLDIVMEQTERDAPGGLQWTFSEQLHDVDYADDICLVAQSFSDIDRKLQKLAVNANAVGLKINIKKTKIMRINTLNVNPLIIEGQKIEDVDHFCYLGSILTKNGGAEVDINMRINKARAAFLSLNKVWRSSSISRKTKLRLFNVSIMSVLLYGCTTWGTTQTQMRKLQTFVNRCLRQVMHIFWPNWVTNEQLQMLANMAPIEKQILRRKWSWLGHILRRPQEDIARTALDWNPQGQRRPGRPKTTWQRTIRRECQQLNISWNEAKLLARDRNSWRGLIDALCS